MYGLIMDNVINEFSLSGAKAKIKGSVAGAAAKMSGAPAGDNTGKNVELQSLFDDLKKNIGTMVAQHKNDITKLGFGPDDTISKSLTEIEAQLASFGQIEVKDSSLMGKAGQFAQDKVLPLVGKVISPISNKIEQMYQKSGPLRDFDAKYEDLRKQITTKYPKLAEPMAKFSEYAKKHKAKATFIIGGLTALLVAATSVGGPGAFVIGVGLRGVYGMLAGESPVKSFGKAAITAAIGKMAGGVIKDLFGDVSLGGGDETLAKAGVGELTGGEEVAGMGPVAAKEAALDALQDKYPDAGSFRELMELDPEGAQELQQQFATSNSSLAKTFARKKIDLLMKSNELADAGRSSGSMVGGELQDAAGGEEAMEAGVDGGAVVSDKVKDAFAAGGSSMERVPPEVLKFLEQGGGSERDLIDMIRLGGSAIEPEVAAELTQKGYSPTQIYNAYLNAYGAKAAYTSADYPSLANFAKEVAEKAGG
jgi:hypothetical protein